MLRTTTGTGVGGRDFLAIRPAVDSLPRRLLAEEYDEVAPALSPAGRFLMVRRVGFAPADSTSEGGEAGRVVPVIDWFQELSQRVPAR